MAKISGKRVVFTSFFVDIIDVVINLIVLILTGSVVMLAEVFQGISDITADIFLIIGISRGSAPRSKRYPFGRGRELFFWTFLAALVTFALSASFSFYFGLHRFLNPEPIENIALAYIVLGIAIVTNAYSASLSFRRLLGKRNPKRILGIFLRSSLVETKSTFVFDLVGSIAATVGFISLVLFGITGDMRFDGIGGMLIGVVLAVLSFTLILGVKDLLIGRRAQPEVEEKIRVNTLEVPEVRDVLDLRTMNIGPQMILVNIEVHIKDGLNTDEIEEVVDRIKAKVRDAVPSIRHIQVELETPER